MLVCRPGSFDPSKIKIVPKEPRSKRRKATRPKRKRTSKVPSERLKSPVGDSSGSQDADEGSEVDVMGGQDLDPLHVGVYTTDDEKEDEGKPMEANSKIPGETIAAALEDGPMEVSSGESIAATLVKTDTFQHQVSGTEMMTLYRCYLCAFTG